MFLLEADVSLAPPQELATGRYR